MCMDFVRSDSTSFVSNLVLEYHLQTNNVRRGISSVLWMLAQFVGKKVILYCIFLLVRQRLSALNQFANLSSHNIWQMV